jgi:hypothetical protein
MSTQPAGEFGELAPVVGALVAAVRFCEARHRALTVSATRRPQAAELATLLDAESALAVQVDRLPREIAGRILPAAGRHGAMAVDLEAAILAAVRTETGLDLQALVARVRLKWPRETPAAVATVAGQLVEEGRLTVTDQNTFDMPADMSADIPRRGPRWKDSADA